MIERLESALITARRIGAAVGILMVTHQLTEAQAWRLLVEKSSTTNRKVRDLAIDVLGTGSLDAYDS